MLINEKQKEEEEGENRKEIKFLEKCYKLIFQIVMNEHLWFERISENNGKSEQLADGKFFLLFYMVSCLGRFATPLAKSVFFFGSLLKG